MAVYRELNFLDQATFELLITDVDFSDGVGNVLGGTVAVVLNVNGTATATYNVFGVDQLVFQINAPVLNLGGFLVGGQIQSIESSVDIGAGFVLDQTLTYPGGTGISVVAFNNSTLPQRSALLFQGNDVFDGRVVDGLNYDGYAGRNEFSYANGDPLDTVQYTIDIGDLAGVSTFSENFGATGNLLNFQVYTGGVLDDTFDVLGDGGGHTFNGGANVATGTFGDFALYDLAPLNDMTVTVSGTTTTVDLGGGRIDTLNGIETLVIGGGNDTLLLGDLGATQHAVRIDTLAGNDIADFRSTTRGANIVLDEFTPGNLVNGQYDLFGVERIILGRFNDALDARLAGITTNIDYSNSAGGLNVTATGGTTTVVGGGDVGIDTIRTGLAGISITGTASSDVFTVALAGLANFNFDAGAARDTLDLHAFTNGVTIDMTLATNNVSDGDTGFGPVFGTATNFERFIGTNNRDTIIGSAADDWMEGAGGADRLVGGLGRDTVDYSHSSGAVTILLGANSQIGGDAQGDALVSIEDVIGSALNDSLTGDAAANYLYGQAGNDTILGNGGVDALLGEDGDDNVSGGTGDDFVLGGAGSDVLKGDDGADYLWGQDGNDGLYGGLGNDVMFGGAGNDYFFQNDDLTPNGLDYIVDFDATSDYIILAANTPTLFFDQAGAAWAAQFTGAAWHYTAVFGTNAAGLQSHALFA